VLGGSFSQGWQLTPISNIECQHKRKVQHLWGNLALPTEVLSLKVHAMIPLGTDPLIDG